MLFKSKGNIKLLLKFQKGIQLHNHYQQGQLEFCVFNESQSNTYTINTDQDLCQLISMRCQLNKSKLILHFQKSHQMMNIHKDELDPHYAFEIGENKQKTLRFNMTRDQVADLFEFINYTIPGLYGWHRINYM